mgnify:FL=1
MGTDIHMWAEVRKSYPHIKDESDRTKYEAEWQTVGRMFKNEYAKSDELITITGDGYSWGDVFTEHPYQQRNYNVFAMLADVRNERGFAGVDTGDGFVPIAMPRGFPPDLSKFMRKKSEDVEHTPSWLSLDELESYDWNQVTKHRGWVNPKEFKEFQERGKPSSWCGGVSGGLVSHVSNERMEQIADAAFDPENFYTYTQVEWESTYADSAGAFYTETLPRLREIRNLPNVTDLRIVFWFDS